MYQKQLNDGVILTLYFKFSHTLSSDGLNSHHPYELDS